MIRRLRNLLISTAFVSTLIMPSAAVFADSAHGNSANAPGQTKSETIETNNSANPASATATNTPTAAPGNSDHSQGNANATSNQTKEKNADKKSTQTISDDHKSSSTTNSEQPTSHITKNQQSQTQSTTVVIAPTAKPSSQTTSHKVTLCHATNSNTNPYVVITVDTNAAGGGNNNGLGGHDKHTGPVWNSTLKAHHTKWGDIIPPFTDSKGSSFPGLNWNAQGQAIFNNGCKVPGGTGGCTQNCGTNTGCTTNCEGGRGGNEEVLGASTEESGGLGAGEVLGVSTELPNTGLNEMLSLWAAFAVIAFALGAVYWRQFIVPLLPRS